ncbi:MAG: carboxypeptidase regulatory-like domain-containing protein [Oleibacter sp.]|nr:carboxypeptidase regulatory-like domain-containing protein [Thalassolituus sp.]
MESLKKFALAFFCLLCFTSPIKSFAYLSGNSDQAAAWLGQQQIDGRIVDSEFSKATEYQSTLEALLSFQDNKNLGSFDRSSAINYVKNPEEITAEYIAKAASLGIQSTADGKNLLAALYAMKNEDGGFGYREDYGSTSLDTGFSLIALNQLNQRNGSFSMGAISYLINHQNSDGGWGLSYESLPYVTAIVMLALKPFEEIYSDVPSLLSDGQRFLFSQSSVEKAWGENFLTAMSALALIPVLSNPNLIDDKLNVLVDSQSDNGSWDQDSFTTALAIQSINAREARRSLGEEVQFGGISGFVYKAGSSEPLIGVDIKIIEIEGLSVISNSDGYFFIPNILEGSYTLQASKPGFDSASSVVNVKEGQVTAAGTLILNVEISNGIFRGQIFDAVTLEPLNSALVTLNGTNFYSSFTNTDGDFEITVVDSDAGSFTIQKDGYVSLNGSATIVAGKITELRQGMRRENSSSNDDPLDIVGTIIDGTTNSPISGATFSLNNSLSVSSNSDGTFVLQAVPLGSYQVSLLAQGYVTQQYSVEIISGASGDLGTFVMYTETESEAPIDIDVSGMVLDGITGKPISDAQVVLSIDGQSVISSENGSFQINGIEVLSFQLSVTAEGYSPGQYNIQASSFGDIQVVLNVSPIPENSDQNSSQLSGVVTNSITGEIVSNVNISIADTGNSTSSDINGLYEFNDINALMFDLNISAPGYGRITRSIQFAEVGNYLLDIELEPIASDRIQILSINSPSDWPANTTAEISAEVVNLTQVVQNVLLIAEVFDNNGASVAVISPFSEFNGNIITSEFEFNAEEKKRLTIPWDTAQFPPQLYQVVLRAVEPGSILASQPRGKIIAEGSGSVILVSTSEITGILDLTPPLTQAGATTPVGLNAIVRNAGNVPFNAHDMELEIINGETNELIYTDTLFLPGLEVGQNTTLDFGSWIPTQTGELIVTIRPLDLNISGQVTGGLYVGDIARGEFTVNPAIVSEGTKTVQAQVSLQGVDTRTGSSTDPLFDLVKDSVQRGGNYVTKEGEAWISRNRCLGCHIQTQSSFGLSSSLDKANIGKISTIAMFNSIASSQQKQGELMDRHPQWPIVQTGLGLWAMSSFPNKEFSFRTKYKAAKYLYSRKLTSGNSTYWRSERTSPGWWNGNTSITSIIAHGYVDLIKSAEDIDISTLTELQFETSVSIGSGDIRDIKISDNGEIFVIKYSGDIDRVNIETGEISTYISGLPYGITGLARGGDGVLYVVGDNRQLLKVNTDLSWEVLYSQSGIMRDIEIGKDGLLYVSDQQGDQILVFDTEGNIQRKIQSGLFANPEGLVFDKDNNLFVSSSDRYSVVRIASDDSVELYAGSLAYRPSRIGLDVNGDLIVASLSKYNTPAGMYRITEGGSAERVSSGKIYRGFDTYNGNSYVVDRSEGRLNKITYIQLDVSLLNSLKAEIPRMANYFESSSRSQDRDNSVLAMRLQGMTVVRELIDDPVLLADIDAAIIFIDDLLRQRQNSDGGWGRYNGQSSDALITALVGIAVDGTNPSPDDPAVRNTIQHLLNKQSSDGSWYNSNNGLGTRLAATSLIMAYMPKALDRLGGINVDLRLTFSENVLPEAFSISPSEIIQDTLNNTEYVWSIDGVTDSGRDIKFDLELFDMELNEVRAAATNAYIEFDNSFTDERLRVDLKIPEITARSELQLVQVSSDKAIYQANEDVTITAIISNTGSTMASGDVVISIIPSGYENPLATLSPFSVIDVPADTNRTVNDKWNTGTTFVGDYIIKAELFDLEGRPLSEQITQITISAPAAAVNTFVSTDKPVYTSWDSALIIGQVQNVAVNASLDSFVAEMKVSDPQSNVIFTENRIVNSLSPSTIQQFNFYLPLSGAIEGQYQVTWTAKDSASGNSLSESITQFKVLRREIQDLLGSVTATNDRIFHNGTNQCHFDLLNRGNAGFDSLQIATSILNVESEQLVLREETTLPLSPSENKQLQMQFEATGKPYGGYICVFEANFGGTWQVIANTIFEVLSPKVNSDISIGTTNRVLVLTDAPRQCSALEDIHVAAKFGAELSISNQITVRLLNEDGVVFDTEVVSVFDVDINQSYGTPSEPDLAVKASASGELEFVLTKPGGIPHHHYQVQVEVKKSWFTSVEKSWSIDSSCDRPLTIGEVYEDLTLLDWNIWRNEEDLREIDPYGPTGAPNLNIQNDFIKGLLDDAGWGYTLVHTAEDFAYEHRTGDYGSYLIMSERPQLHWKVQKEIREAVVAGKGLIVAGAYDKRNHWLEPALGMDVVGHHPWARELNLNESSVTGEQQLPLVYEDRVQGIWLDGASLIGEYTLAADQSEGWTWLDQHSFVIGDIFDFKRKAITQYEYGDGKSLFFGFDLLLEATSEGVAGAYSTLLLDSLEWIQHEFNEGAYPFSVVPVDIEWVNNRGAVQVTSTLTSSGGASVVDAEDFVEEGNTLSTNFEMAEQEVRKQKVYVELSEQPVQQLILETITIDGDQRTVQADASIELFTQSRPSLDSTQGELDNLAWQYWYRVSYRSAWLKFKLARSAFEAGYYNEAQGLFLITADLLLVGDEPEVISARKSLYSHIETTGRLLALDQ